MIDILKPILDIYDTKKDVLLFYLEPQVRFQVEDLDYLDDDNDLFLNDKVFCIKRSTLEVDVVGFIQAIKGTKISLKVKSRYGVHVNQDEYHIFIKRRKCKKNDRDFYKALLNAL
jgi:hypothetical protein